jgi:cytochrome c oxidase assembly protein subunit 15
MRLGVNSYFQAMNPNSLYDLTPLASLLLVGLLVALGPLTWVHWKQRRGAPLQRVQALRLLTLFLTFDLIVFGAFTRLTDSGLGCPDWPGCYGNTSPLGAEHAISMAQFALPTGPVTFAKAWIEMLHRYLAMAVGALIVVITALGWMHWRKRYGRALPSTEISPWWATVTLAWVCVQGAFGALTVTMKLFPAIVTLHLAGALVLLVLQCIQVVRGSRSCGQKELLAASRHWAVLTYLMLVLQILLGGWVSTNYAMLACQDFPMCQGHWWPEMNFKQGFEIWRHLGLTSAGESIGFLALTAIHYVHRLGAYLVLLLLAGLAWQLNRQAIWRTQSRLLAALTGLQLVTGLSNVLLDWPLLSALMHTGGAAALLLTLTWVLACAKVSTLHRVQWGRPS